MSHETWKRLHRLANAEFDFRVRQILPEWWVASTPCDEWDVAELVNHNVVESMWVAPLLAGMRIEDVGGLVGDVLGEDALSTWEDARAQAIQVVDDADLDQLVQLSAGPTPGFEYVRQRVLDLAVHAWDLAIAIDVDDKLDSELIDALDEYVRPFAARLAELPEYFETAITSAPDADRQSRLLNLLGRETD
jgi:uncharacterized protein (TIGR03086 family)